MSEVERWVLTRREALAVGALAAGSLALGEARAEEAKPAVPAAAGEPLPVPAWVRKVTRMAFITPGELDRAGKAGVQVVHFNMIWPYYPLRRDGGKLSENDAKQLREFVERCHATGIKASLGLPPFPSVEAMRAHPDWRIHPQDNDAALKIEPKEDLGTRLGCNNGPWGDFLIELCGELVEDYHVDGFSFDGNYHPPICYCPACKAVYLLDTGKPIPAQANLDLLEYRQYLTWRGELLEDHYRRLQARIKKANPDTALMSWTVNAGRYGQLLSTPRSMPSRLNRIWDLPMQEWWLDESNLGSSVAPAFGAAYLRGTTGGRPNASEPYLMSRGNPYGTYSFPRHERVTRSLLALTHGSLPPQSFGWAGHGDSTADVLAEVKAREPWVINAQPVPWAAMLVSEQTRQFHTYGNIPEQFLPHVFGAFRAALEEHLALDLVNDWDLTPERLEPYSVLILPHAAALSSAQCEAIRTYVREGGGLVATCETSLFDELGRPRPDFALADLFGVSYRGHSTEPKVGTAAPAPEFWTARAATGTLAWVEHPITKDARLTALVPERKTLFKGPRTVVSMPPEAERIATFTPEGGEVIPAIAARQFGKGRVAYLPIGVDAALWSYSFPYQRVLLAGAIAWVASEPCPASVQAPMCIQATYYQQPGEGGGNRVVVHLFNNLDSTAGHGIPGMDVPLREESVPVHGIRVTLRGEKPKSVHVEPGGFRPRVRNLPGATEVELPPLEVHGMLVAEY